MYGAWVPGVPGVYAAADTARQAKQALRGALKAHLATLEGLGRGIDKIKTAELSILVFAANKSLHYANLASTLLGRRTRTAKARARLNGRKGGRPASHAR